MTNLKDFPNPRNFDYYGKNSCQRMFDSDGYLNTIEKWKESLEKDLTIEHLWCEAKIGNPTSSQVENDYFRGYMQGLDRVLKGIQPTEIECALQDNPKEGKHE